MDGESAFSRTEQLIGAEGMACLKRARVAVFGIGGVGGYVVEALTRSGVGRLALIDSDVVGLSNLNRQIIATHDTIGRYKTEVMAERVRSINPEAEVSVYNCFYLPETAEQFDFAQYDYVVDAVDTVTAKLEIIQQAKRCGVPVISSMGAGNKLDPTRFQVADIYATSVCPLAKVMRRELRKRGVESLKVVYSTEPPVGSVGEAGQAAERGPSPAEDRTSGAAAAERGPSPAAGMPVRRGAPGSIAFVPSVAGLILAGEVVKDLVGEKD